MPCLDVEAAYLLQRWAGNSFAFTWRPPGLVGRFVTGLSFSPCIQSISPKSLPRPFLRKIGDTLRTIQEGCEYMAVGAVPPDADFHGVDSHHRALVDTDVGELDRPRCRWWPRSSRVET